MISRVLGAVTALALVAGCEAHSDIKSPPVAVAYTEGFDAERVKMTTPIAFRTYLAGETDEDGKPKQVAGATCRIKSREIQAEFVTPALIEMPVIKGRPSVMHASCKAGDKTGAFNFEPFKPHTVFIGDPVSMVVANLASAAVTAASDRWQYHSVDNTDAIGIVLE